jgi:hypothetical protein
MKVEELLTGSSEGTFFGGYMPLRNVFKLVLNYMALHAKIWHTSLFATFADDTVILALDQNPIAASEKLQNHFNILQHWLNKWKIKVNNDKSVHINFTTRSTEIPQPMLNDELIPPKNEVKYLGLHFDQKLTWKALIKAKDCSSTIKHRK